MSHLISLSIITPFLAFLFLILQTSFPNPIPCPPLPFPSHSLSSFTGAHHQTKFHLLGGHQGLSVYNQHLFKLYFPMCTELYAKMFPLYVTHSWHMILSLHFSETLSRTNWPTHTWRYSIIYHQLYTRKCNTIKARKDCLWLMTYDFMTHSNKIVYSSFLVVSKE